MHGGGLNGAAGACVAGGVKIIVGGEWRCFGRVRTDYTC